VSRVVTYQHAYIGGTTALCDTCLADQRVLDLLPSLGAVSHGDHEGCCDGCALALQLRGQGVRALADRIADEHGCEILPTHLKVPAIRVLPFYTRGAEVDRPKIEACRNAIEAEGISTDGWVS
jgi:hypothetical protein